MSTPEYLLAKGKSCIEAAKTAHEYLLQSASSSDGKVSPGAEETLNCLASLREDGRQLKAAAQLTKQDHQEHQKALLQQLAAMTEKPHDLDAALARLNLKRQQEESRLLKLQRSLEVSQNKLRAAEDQVRRAKLESRAKSESADKLGPEN